jgi:hypothetical protein
MIHQDYQFREDFFRIVHWSKGRIVFLFLAIIGWALIVLSDIVRFGRDVGIALVRVGPLAPACALLLQQVFLGGMTLELSESLFVDTPPTTESQGEWEGPRISAFCGRGYPTRFPIMEPVGEDCESLWHFL